MFVVLLGTGATVFYNMISNMLRALGDSKTPLYFLVFSSVLNIFLDILFIVPMHMGVAGAAWATILSQFLSAVLSLLVGMKKFQILHLHREDFYDLKDAAVLHLENRFSNGVSDVGYVYWTAGYAGCGNSLERRSSRLHCAPKQTIFPSL